jgi:hypothetical protein
MRVNNNNGYISIYNSAGSTRTGYIQGLTGSSLVFAAENSAILQFNVGGSERARIDTAGNIGIGTTGTFTLNVYNNADVWHARFGGITGEVRIGGQTSSGAVIQAFIPSSGTFRDLYIQRDGGNVGIGNSSPATLLQIGTGTPTATTGGIQFGGDTSARLYRSAPGIITCSGTIAATFSGNLTGNATNVTGIVALANGGSGQNSAQAAMNAFAGAVTSGSYLRGNGTNVVMSTIQVADVPTLNQSTTGNAATASLATTSDRLTSRDNRTISSNEDDAFRLRFGFTSWANNDSSPYADYLHLRSYSDASGGNDNLVMFRKDAIGMRIYQAGFGTSVAYSSFKDVAFTDQSFFIGTTSVAINRGSATLTLNGVNVSGTSANVTGTVAIANGGTGTTTAQLAINALAGAVTNAQYLRGNGTNVVMSAIQVSDVPTLNQNTTGSSGSCTGNAATATNASQLGGAVAARYVRNDTDGTAGDLFSLVTVTKSLTVTTSWIDTGISAGSDLVSGAYILTLNVDNYAAPASGGQYNETYTGIMYWYAGATNSAEYDEIPLHKSGHAPNGRYINLRTLRGVSGVLKLQIICNIATGGASNYIFKFRRMI